jgi:hypothetical protein
MQDTGVFFIVIYYFQSANIDCIKFPVGYCSFWNQITELVYCIIFLPKTISRWMNEWMNEWIIIIIIIMEKLIYCHFSLFPKFLLL